MRPSAPPRPAKAPTHEWYSGITNAFAHTAQQVQRTVATAVTTVQQSVTAAGTSLGQAGQSVQRAGHAVADAGRALVSAAGTSARDVRTVARDVGTLVGDAGQVVANAGSAALHAGHAVLAGDPGELETARSALSQARANVDQAHAALADAHRHLSDLGTQATKVSTAIGHATTQIGHARTALDHALHQVDATVHAVVGAPLGVMSGVERALTEGGAEVRSAIERDVPGGPAMLEGLDAYASGAKQVVGALARGDAQGLAKGMRDEAQGLLEFGKGAWKAGAPLVDFAKQKLLEQVQGFDVTAQVKSLKPSESYKVSLGANVHAEFGGEAMGSLGVTANEDGTFTVEAGGSAGLNGYLEGGGSLGSLKAGVDASGHALAGAKLTLTCSSAEEAARAAALFEKLAAASTIPGAMALGTQALTRDDLAFLTAKTTGLELSGSLAADAGAALGFDAGPLRAGLGVKLGQGGSTSVRLDLRNGTPVGLTVKDESTFEVSGNAGVSLGKPSKPDAGKKDDGPAKWKPELEGKVEAKVSLETHYELPSGLTLAQFQKDPVAALGAAALEMGKTATSVVKTSVEADGQALDAHGTSSTDLTFTGKPAEIFNGDAILKAVRGDLPGALAAMGSQVAVEGAVRTVDTQSWGVDGLGVSVLGVGVSGSFTAEKRHANPPSLEFSGTAAGLTSTMLERGDELRRRATVRG